MIFEKSKSCQEDCKNCLLTHWRRYIYTDLIRNYSPVAAPITYAIFNAGGDCPKSLLPLTSYHDFRHGYIYDEKRTNPQHFLSQRRFTKRKFMPFAWGTSTVSGPCPGRVKSVSSPNKSTFIGRRHGADTEQIRSGIPCEADLDA